MLAIDFGTSNTAVARWNAATGQPELVPVGDLSYQRTDWPPLVPSLVYLKATTGDDRVSDWAAPIAARESGPYESDNYYLELGQRVLDQGLDRATDGHLFKNFKRGIGAAVQGFMPTLGGRPLSFETVGTWFLTGIIDRVRQQQPDLNSVIFTVPVDSFEAYRSWLTGVCDTLDIEQVRLLDEPTAAALGYGLGGDETVLVVDLGGGTLDFSLVQLPGSPGRKPLGSMLKWGSAPLRSGPRSPMARVIAKAGEALGGSDIDGWLAEHFAATQNSPITPLTLRLAERLKIRLSSETAAQESYFDDETLDSYDLSLDRAQLETILRQRGLFERLDARLQQVLQQARRAGIDPSDIDAVLAVGGTAQIPAVQSWLRTALGQDNVPKIALDRPFTAVVEGALQLQRGVTLSDFLYHSYGIRYWDRRQNCHGWHPVIAAGQPYPMTEPVELVLGASVDQQPSIELVLGELGAADQATEVFFEQGRLVTRQGRDTQLVKPLNDREGARAIAVLSPPGFPGTDRVRVAFRVDENRFLRLSVEDLLTGQTLVENAAAIQLR